MDVIKGILSAFIIFICIENVHSQLSKSDIDSLDYYYANKEWKLYFIKLKLLGDSAIVRNNSKVLLRDIEPYLFRVKANDDKALKFSLRKGFTQQASKYKKLGDYPTALEWYLKAHELVDDKFCLDEWAWYVENEIANINTRFGDFEKAEYFVKLTEQSLIYYKNDNQLCRLYTNMGTLYYSKSDFKNAISFYTKGNDIALKMTNNLGLLANSTGLAKIYILYGETNEALNKLQYALTACERLDTNSINYLQSQLEIHWSLAKLYILKKDSTKVINEFNLTFKYLKSIYRDSTHREFGKLYNDIAKFYFNRSDLENCEIYLIRGFNSFFPTFNSIDDVPDENELYPENLLTDLFLTASNLFYKKYLFTNSFSSFEMCIEYLRLGLSVNEKIRNRITADPSKLLNINLNKSLVDLVIGYLWDLYQLNPSEKIIAQARVYFNSSKALLLNEKSIELELYSQLNPTDRNIIEELEKHELDIYAKSADIIDKDSIRIEIYKTQSEIKKILSKYKNTQIAYTYPSDYVEYNIQDSFVYVLATLQGKQYFDRIGKTNDLKEICFRINQEISRFGEGSIQDTPLQKAYLFLLGFTKDELPKKICIIPDGIIQFIPFEILKSQSGNFLLQDVLLSYSYTYRQSKNNRPHSDKSLSIYAVKPQYNGNLLENNFATRGNLYRLSHTSKEIDALKTVFGNRTVVDSSGDKRCMLDGMKSANMLHYAGHAQVRADSAFLILSEYDNTISLDEIKSQRIPFKMVVLSACETGLGEWEYGEGIRSLGKSFQESGAESVVMSLWSVNDESTAMIMNNFYNYISMGFPKDEALNKAKSDYLSAVSLDRKHPYYWAGFIPIGSMDALEFGNNVNWTNFAIVLSILFSLLISFFVLKFSN